MPHCEMLLSNCSTPVACASSQAYRKRHLEIVTEQALSSTNDPFLDYSRDRRQAQCQRKLEGLQGLQPLQAYTVRFGQIA
jgi:hypothetical protein